MTQHVFEIFVLMELRKFNFKPAGYMLFYDTELCPQFVHALIVAEHGTKRCWFCFVLFFLLEKKVSRNILCTAFWKSRRTKRLARLANFGFFIFTCLSKCLCQMLLLTVCRKKRESDCEVLVQKVQPVRLFVSLVHVGLYCLF